MNWLIRLFRRSPVIYIHPSFVTRAKVSRVLELLRQVALWKWEDLIAREMSRKSPLLDPRFGLVGSGPGSLIQVRTG